MPRISRRVGPDASFNFLSTDQDIPQLSITRNFGDGPLLILCTLRLNNIVAGATLFDLHIDVDGVQAEGSTFTVDVGAGRRATACWHSIQQLPPGLHTIKARGRCTVANDGQMNLNRGVLTVIELPAWEVTADLTL